MPSEETYSDQLRRELNAATQSAFFRTGKIVDVLSKISEFKDTGFIRDLVPLLWAKEEEVVFEVAATLSLLVPRVSSERLPDMDASLRAGWPYWAGLSLDGDQMNRLKASSSWWSTFAVLASHPSGFARQAAIEELAREEAGESLRFILLRTTDWVAPVRATARDVFLRKLAEPNIDQLDRCLPLVFRMRNGLRHQPDEIFELIERLVGSRKDITLDDKDSNHSSAFLRYRFKLARQHGRQRLDQLLDIACRSSSDGVKLLACDWLAEAETPVEVRDRYGRVFLGDKIPLVRVRAFWRIANAEPQNYLPEIETALLDSSAAVQDTARGAWRLLLKRDPLPFYRVSVDQVGTITGIIAALRGLRAEGSLKDETLVRRFLQHRSAKVKREVLRTLVAWNSPDASALLLDGLRSKSALYSKGAALLLSARPDLLSISLVKDLLLHPKHPDARKMAFWLFTAMPKWSALPLIFTAYSLSNYREQAATAFENWNRNYNRNHAAPSIEEAREAMVAFNAIAGLPLASNRSLVSIISFLKETARC